MDDIKTLEEKQKIFDLISELEARLYYLYDEEPKFYIKDAHTQTKDLLHLWGAFTGLANN